MWPHLHLLLNHFPTVGFCVGAILFAVAFLGRNKELARAGLAVTFLIAVLSIAVYVSGSAAEDGICPPGAECLPGVSKAAIAAHEDAAILGFILMELTGAAAFLGLWQIRRGHALSTAAGVAVLVLSAASFLGMARAAAIGGEIRHPEIQAGPSAADSGAGSEIGWLKAEAIKSFVTTHRWVWPACETLHFIGLSMLFTVVLIVDLRLLGMMKRVSFAAVYQLIPLGILGFGINLMTGILFFIGIPGQYVHNVTFFWKMLFVVLGGLNVLYFLLDDAPWNVRAGDAAPMSAKLAAASALFIWAAVLFCGHMLPFIGNAF